MQGDCVVEFGAVLLTVTGPRVVLDRAGLGAETIGAASDNQDQDLQRG